MKATDIKAGRKYQGTSGAVRAVLSIEEEAWAGNEHSYLDENGVYHGKTRKYVRMQESNGDIYEPLLRSFARWAVREVE